MISLEQEGVGQEPHQKIQLIGFGETPVALVV
jgi:hypothetical protein